MAEQFQEITSDSFVGQEQSKGINSNASLYLIQSKELLSNTSIKEPIFIYGSVQVTKSGTDTVYVQTDVSNPIPSAPTFLAGVNAGLGDVVRLTWTSSASFFNVYKKVGLTYTKLNPNTIEGVTSYNAGGLTPDVAVTFVVRAANGLGQESSDSNAIIVTPTLNVTASRFTSPTYSVTVNGFTQSTAILESVELGFGSDLSTATFWMPTDPRTTGFNLGDLVEVYINSRLLFRGYITIRSDSIDESGLKITYTCHSTIIDLTRITLYSTDVDGTDTVFNGMDTTPEGYVKVLNPANANTILEKLGVTGGPDLYPGEVNLTDQTPLSAAEMVIARLGNYKLYHDMVNGETTVYNYGSNGTSVREFQFAKNIVSYRVEESNIDIVNQVKVIGAPKAVRVKRASTSFSKQSDGSGALMLEYQVSGKNIRDIQVYGWGNEKPLVKFDEEIEVGINDFIGAGSGGSFGYGDSFTLDTFSLSPLSINTNTSFSGSGVLTSPDGQDSGSFFGEPTNNDTTNEADLRPIMISEKKYHSTRKSIGATITYSGKDAATIKLSEIPKLWYTVTRRGQVSKIMVGKDARSLTDTMTVQILLQYDFRPGAVEVEYTVDEDPPVVVSGSGEPMKTITDTQYEIVQNVISKPIVGGIGIGSSFNNNDETLRRMQFRANYELARLHTPNLGGTITIIGDETVDLRASVRVKGQLLEISHVSHSWANGYLTTVTLTNEPYVRNVVFPSLYYQDVNSSKNNEHKYKSVFWDLRSQGYMQAKTQLQKEKDRNDKKEKSSGKSAVWGE
jgi:hypothetical protein